MILLNLPLYLDNIGSILTAALGGPIPGMVAAFTANYLGYFGEPSAIMFGVLTVTMACLASQLSRAGLLRKIKGYVILWIMMVVIGGAVGSVMGWYLYGKTVGGTIAAPYVFWLCDHGLSGFWAQFLGDVLLDMTDKFFTVVVVALALRFFPRQLRGMLPLSYLYRYTDEELAAEQEKRKLPFTGRSVFNRIVLITVIALTLLAAVVTCYGTRSYYVNKFCVDGDTYALFGYVVQLLGLEFVVIVLAIIISGWMTYATLIKPLQAIVRQTVAFGNTDHEKWMETDAWKYRFDVKTKDEIQVLYDAICRSEEMLSRELIHIRENENKLKRLSETDLMTGIRNRGSGEREICRLIKEGVPGLFCLLDCDKFKSINDTYGHTAGDEVLIAIADNMRKNCGEQDIVLRLGGDEFAMYLRGIQRKEQAEEFFETFFQSLEKLSVPGLKGAKFTVSLGAAFSREGDGLGFDDLYKQADLALYESKKKDGFAADIAGKTV